MDPTAVQEAFDSYASAQVTYGLQLLGKHRDDDHSCCRECGEPYPCAARRRAGELIIHFSQWGSPSAYADPAPRRLIPARRRPVPVDAGATQARSPKR
jgi:hypothetical protein